MLPVLGPGGRCAPSGQAAMRMPAAVLQQAGSSSVSQPPVGTGEAGKEHRGGREGAPSSRRPDGFLPCGSPSPPGAAISGAPPAASPGAGRRVPGPQSSVSPPVQHLAPDQETVSRQTDGEGRRMNPEAKRRNGPGGFGETRSVAGLAAAGAAVSGFILRLCPHVFPRSSSPCGAGRSFIPD